MEARQFFSWISLFLLIVGCGDRVNQTELEGIWVSECYPLVDGVVMIEQVEIKNDDYYYFELQSKNPDCSNGTKTLEQRGKFSIGALLTDSRFPTGTKALDWKSSGGNTYYDLFYRDPSGSVVRFGDRSQTNASRNKGEGERAKELSNKVYRRQDASR